MHPQTSESTALMAQHTGPQPTRQTPPLTQRGSRPILSGVIGRTRIRADTRPAAQAPLPLLAAILLTPIASPTAAQTNATSLPATVPYLDRTHGFELQLPANWHFDRTGFPGPEDSLGLIRGQSPGGLETLQILVFRQPRMPRFPAWIEHFSRQIGSISETTRVTVMGNQSAERPEAVVAVDSQIGADRTHSLYYCVQFDPSTIWVFSYAVVLGPDEWQAKAAARARFEQLAGTLRVHYNPADAEKLRDALTAGLELRETQLPQLTRRLRPDESERYYEILFGGQPVGYMSRRLTRTEQSIINPLSRLKKPGLRVRERAWRFADDGSAHYTRVDLFASDDLESDLLEIQEAHIPPEGSSDASIFTTLDQCIRQGDALFSIFTTSRDMVLPDPRRPLQLDRTFLGLAWVRLLPALVGTAPTPPRAFVIYDSQTRTLTTHMIEPLGPAELPGEPQTRAFVYRTREGLVDRPAMLFTDEQGLLLRLDAGELTLQQITAQRVESRYGPRREQVTRRLGTP